MKKMVFAYANQRWLKNDPNTTWDLYPSTLCLLAAMVRDIVEIKIIDAHFYNLTQEEFKKVIEDYNPDYVSFSILTSEYGETLDIGARIVKSVNPNIVVIAGGVHVTTNYEYVVKNPFIDFCVRGEGEYVLRDLIISLNGDAPLPKTGLVYKRGVDIIVQERAIVEDLSKIPWPAYDLIDLNAYLTKPLRDFGPQRAPDYPCLNIVTTRGCPFGCSFCQVEQINGKKVRARDPEDVINELLFLKQKYGVKSLIFLDDNLLMAPDKYAERLFSLMIEKELKVKWIGMAFALFLLTDELLELMRKSGCVGINVAIESGNERVIKEIVHKPIKDLKKVPEIIRKIQSKGMFCITNFIIGFPGETWDEIRDTIRFAENCGSDYVKIFIAVPLKGTKLYKIAYEKKYLSGDPDTMSWRYGTITSDEWTSKDVSILRAYEWDRINFSREKIQRTAEIWGLDIKGLQKIRKETRDSLNFNSDA